MLQRLSRIGSEAASLIVKATDLSSPLKIAALGFHVVQKYTDTPVAIEDILTGYRRITECGKFEDTVFGIIKERHAVHGVFEKIKDHAIHRFNINGFRVARNYIQNKHFGQRDPLWVDKTIPPEEVQKFFGQLLWEHFGSALEIESTYSQETYSTTTQIRKDGLSILGAHKSQLAQEVIARIEPFKRANIPRAVLFYGPPGTGKSCLMRYIADQLGTFSLRMNLNGLVTMSSEEIQKVVRLLQPNVVLFDDIDRQSTSTILSHMEVLRACKVILASANDIAKIDAALLRAGRFDEIIPIEKMDDGVLAELIGDGLSPEIVEKLRKLPVAYVKEFHLRRTILGEDVALTSLEELSQRAEDIAAKSTAPKP